MSRNIAYCRSCSARTVGSGVNVAATSTLEGTSAQSRLAHPDGRDERSAAGVGHDRVRHLGDRGPEDVGHGLAPQRRPSTPSDEPQRGEPVRTAAPGEALDRLQHPAGVERDALEDAAGEVGAGRREGHVEPAASQVRVVDRRALPVEPRREHDTVAARRRAGREAVETVQGVRRRRWGRRGVEHAVLGIDNGVEQPVDGLACDVLHGGDPVLPRHDGRKGGDVVHDVRALERHVAAQPRRRADVEVRVVVTGGARAHRGRRGVPCARDDPHAVGQPECRGNVGPHRPDDAPGAHELRQPTEVETAASSQGRVPVDRGRVAVVGAPAQDGRVPGGDRAAREPHREVLGDVEQVGRHGIHLRALVPQPGRLAHRVLAGAGRHSPGHRDPVAQGSRVVAARHSQAASGELLRVAATP